MRHMDSLPPRFDITEAEIARVVATFYAAVRRHEVLAPIFAVCFCSHIHNNLFICFVISCSVAANGYNNS